MAPTRSFLAWFSGTVERVEARRFGFITAIFIFAGASIIRNIAEPLLLHEPSLSLITFYHRAIFIVAVFALNALFLSLWAGKKPLAAFRAVASVAWISIFPPFIDGWLFGRTANYDYISGSTISAYFKGLVAGPAVSHGIQLELIVFSGLMFLYVLVSTKSWWRAGGLVIAAMGLDFLLSMPGVWMRVSIGIAAPNLPWRSLPQAVYLIFYFAVAVLSLAAAVIIQDRRYASALVRAVRWPETFHFVIMAGAGLLLADRAAGLGGAGIPFSLFTLAIVVYIYLYAALINDAYDIPVDVVSNPRRPIVAGLMTPVEAVQAARFFAVAALALGFLVGYEVRWLVPVALLLAWVYSSPPIRLRRYVFSSLVIGIGSMLAFLIGYLSMDFNGSWVLPAPIKLVSLVILIAFSAGQMIRDLKDFAGDKAAGITTLFTVFGRERGKQFMTVLLGVCFLVPLAILHSWPDVLVYLLAGAASVFFFQVREAADRVILLSSAVALYTVFRLLV